MNAHRKLIIIALILATLAGNLPPGAQAAPNATITVQSAADDGTANATNCPGVNCRLRDAIAYASAGDTITYDNNYTITLASQLTIGGSMTIDGTGHSVIVSGNNATRVFNVTAGHVTFAHLTIADGNAQTLDCYFPSLQCGGGILIQNIGSVVTVTHSTLVGNSARDIGGGIFNSRGLLTVTHSAISDNSAAYGGGIANDWALVVQNSTFAINMATSEGGGIYNSYGPMTMTNSTLSGNSATANGGGLYNYAGTVDVMNSTLTGNSAASGSGGIGNDFGTITVTNSIIAAQTAGADCVGAIISQGYNIESATTCGFNQTGDQQNVANGSLNLQVLANNGILPHPFTHALGVGSAAMDKIPNGVNGCVAGVSTDERGAVRAGGGAHGGALCDIGAYEVSDQGPNIVTLRDLTAAVNTPSSITGVLGAAFASLAMLSALSIGRRVKAKARP